MHKAAMRYIKDSIQDMNFAGWHIVEIGSYNVNGSVRPLFKGAESYTGVDLRPGNGVDVVADGCTWQPESKVDVVVSTEMLEHCADQRGAIANFRAMLRPGGLLLLTAAGEGRAAHGNDGTPLEGEAEPYANVTAEALYEWLAEAGFINIDIMENARDADIYATATKTWQLDRRTTSATVAKAKSKIKIVASASDEAS